MGFFRCVLDPELLHGKCVRFRSALRALVRACVCVCVCVYGVVNSSALQAVECCNLATRC